MQPRQKLHHHRGQRLCAGADAEYVVIGAHDRGRAAVPRKPARDDAVIFGDRTICAFSARRADADDPQSGIMCLVGDRRRGCKVAAAIEDETPSDAADGIEQLAALLRAHPRLRKQRAVRRMHRAGEQSLRQRRHDVLACDGAGFTVALGEDAGVARLGGDGIALADHMADRLDARGELAHMGAALHAVAVEQRVTGLSAQHPVELPDEIGDVADALAHALADERRLLMGGVARQEHPAASPVPCDQRMKAIARRSPQRGVIRREPWRQQPPDLIRLLHRARIFVRQQHDLEAAMVAGADDEGGGPRRIAELRRRLRQLCEGSVVHLQVDHQPRLVEYQIVEGNAELLAHAAGGAVACDDVVGCDRVCRAAVAAQLQCHAIGRLREADEFGAEVDGDAGIVLCMLPQHRFHRRLGEHHARRVAQRVGLAHHVDAADQLSPGAEMLRGRERRDERAHAFGNIEIIQEPQDLVIDRDSPRLVVDLALAVDRQGADVAVAEQACCHRAGGAEAHHHDLKLVWFVRARHQVSSIMRWRRARRVAPP